MALEFLNSVHPLHPVSISVIEGNGSTKVQKWRYGVCEEEGTGGKGVDRVEKKTGRMKRKLKSFDIFQHSNVMSQFIHFYWHRSIANKE